MPAAIGRRLRERQGCFMLYLDVSKKPRERAKDLLSRMTIKEKAGQLPQRLLGFKAYTYENGKLTLTDEFKDEVRRCCGLGTLYGLYRADPWSQRDFSNGLVGIEMKRAYNLAQKYVIEHSRFGIPMLTSSECPHGHQALDGYLLPPNLAIGATWNPELAHKAFAVCARQLRELGVDFALISMLDVLRDPRWGRSEECYGEDPFLAASFAETVVNACQEKGLAVVAKHFCAQGETTGGVNASAARIGIRELQEIHLAPMRACCKASVQGVMAAYNEIDGVYCHANRVLLKDILRGEIGFKGLVMADGIAIDRLDTITGSPLRSGALALSCGVDIGLWDESFSCLEEALHQGLISEETLDESVLRVLELKFSRGLFEHPYLDEETPKDFSYGKYPESLEISRQSPVLLKNLGILPLKDKKQTVALIGPNSDAIYSQLGDYTPPQREGVGKTLLMGLQEEMGDRVHFLRGCATNNDDSNDISYAVKLANECDIVILALGGSSSRFAGATFDSNGAAIISGAAQMDCGEGVDCCEVKLPGNQEKLAEAIFETGKPVITVIIAGRPYAVNEVIKRSKAVIYAFYPGPMGGKALAEILTGKIAPAGRLPVSLPKSAGCIPCSYNYKASANLAENPWLYPFGFGKTYTCFELSDLKYSGEVLLSDLEKGGKALIQFTVKNIGNYDAYAVPQLFVKRIGGSVVPRVKELKAFCKLFLQAGEKKDCSLEIGREELASFTVNMAWELETGEIYFSLEEGAEVYADGSFIIK